MMPINPTYPGVYVEELESSVHPIVGVQTSKTAFIGRAKTGPRDKATTIHSFEEYVRIFGGLSRDSSMSYAVYQYFLNGGADAIIVAIDDNAKPDSLVRKFTLTGTAASDGLHFESLDVGKVNKGFSVVVEQNKDATDLVNLHVKTYYDTSIKFADWLKESSTLESFYRLALPDTSPHSIRQVLKDNSKYINIKKGDVVDSTTTSAKSVGVYQAEEKGAEGTPADTIANELTRIIPEDRKAKKGIYALDDVDIFNILCIPPLQQSVGKNKVELDIPSGVYSSALKYCKDKRAILIIDPPKTWNTKSKPLETTTGIDVTFGSLRDKNAAIFFPRILAPDPLDGYALREFVPCGFVAGVMARTDVDRGVWKAPAGIQAGIAGASSLTVKLTDAENGELNPIGINCLRIKPPAGIVVWGSRTMRGADELADQWKYLPVRRLALYLEESLYRGTQWVVFEPNDERLWAEIRLNVGSFMQDLFTKGAFQGITPKEAYLVKCDHDTTTQLDIDRGTVNIVVGFAPLKPAEFVILQIKQLAGHNMEAKV